MWCPSRRRRLDTILFGLLAAAACCSPWIRLEGDAGPDDSSGETTTDCGDGLRQAGEECDDGNRAAGDGCEPDCRFSCHESSDCEDGLFCTDDECVWGPVAGRICASVVREGFCAIADACWSSGEAPLERSCDVCAPERDPLAWSPAPAGTLCDNGIYCDGPDACGDAGACVSAGFPPCPVSDCQACDEIRHRCSTATAGTPCRPSRGSCDPPEVCDGIGVACPADTWLADGSRCDDADPCTDPDRCDATGNCVGDSSAVVPSSPSPVWPPNGTLTGSIHAPPSFGVLRPELRWVWETDGCSSPTFVVELDDDCPGSSPDTCDFPSPESTGAGITHVRWRPPVALPVAAAAPVGRRYYWRVRACRGEACSGWSAVRYLDVGRSYADFDGDGFSDVVVGAPGRTTMLAGDGAVLLFHGSRTGIAPAAGREIVNPVPEPVDFGGRFGFGLGVGDFDADGFSDLAVGAPEQDVGGAVFLYQGGVGGLQDVAAAFVTEPSRIAGASFGAGLVAGKDLDSDGHADVVVAAPTRDGTVAAQGGAYWFKGSPAGLQTAAPVLLTSPEAEASLFGLSLDLVDDLNGDGTMDLLVGAPSREGLLRRAYVFLGRAAGPLPTPDLRLANPDPPLEDLFGAVVAGLGDLDDDGYGDVAIGWTTTTAGMPGRQVYVYGGAAAGLIPTPTTILADPLGSAGVEFAGCIALVGDVNGDGRPGFVVAAASRRSAYLYEAADGPGGPRLVASFTGAEEFGAAVSTAGDVNGDGFADFVVGAPGDTSDVLEGGSATVFYGTSDPSLFRSSTVVIDQPRARLGSAVR